MEEENSLPIKEEMANEDVVVDSPRLVLKVNNPKIMLKKKKGVLIPLSRPIDMFLNVKSRETHYNLAKNGLYGLHSPEFNVLTIEATNSNYPFKIIDPFFLCENGVQPVCHKSLTSKQLEIFREKSHKKWDKNFNAELLQMAFDKKKFFTDERLDWKKTINFLAYQGLDKDSVIVECLKSLTFPIPNVLRFQSLNPHTVMITQTKTGKTTTLTELGWKPLSGTTLTPPGLFGGGMNYQAGVAGGWGVLGIDECGKVRRTEEDNVGVLEYCLEYLQKGDLNRIVHNARPCKGTKTFCLFSNPESSRDVFMPFYVKSLLGKLGALSEQVSSRLGLIVFGTDFKQVWNESNVNREALSKLSLIIKEVWIEQQKKWIRLMDSYIPWMGKNEEDYHKKFNDLTYNDDSIYRFLTNGIGKFHNRSKCAALKLTVVNNLDKFYTCKNISDFRREIAYELDANWEFIKKVNLKSASLISNVEEMTRERFWKLCDSQKLHLIPIAELEKTLNVPWSTLKDWVVGYKLKDGNLTEGMLSEL